MSSIISTISAFVTPEMVSGLGKQLGLSDELTRRGIGITNAVLTGGLARASRTAEGSAMIADIIGKADSGVLSNLAGIVSNTNGNANNAAEQIFGANLAVVTNGVKKATGIDITPILPICVPVVLAVTKNLATQQKLDADGLAKLLQADVRGLNRQDPATAKVVKEIFKPLEAQDKLRAAFSDDEWAKLRAAPMYAAALVILADRSGGGRGKEIEALLAALAEAATNAGPSELLGLLFSDGITPAEVEALIREHRKADDQTVRDTLLPQLTEVVTIVKAKASVGDTTAYQGLLIDVAQKVANAAKEGGFLGVGGTLISTKEKLAIDELVATVAAH